MPLLDWEEWPRGWLVMEGVVNVEAADQLGTATGTSLELYDEGDRISSTVPLTSRTHLAGGSDLTAWRREEI